MFNSMNCYNHVFEGPKEDWLCQLGYPRKIKYLLTYLLTKERKKGTRILLFCGLSENMDQTLVLFKTLQYMKKEQRSFEYSVHCISTSSCISLFVWFIHFTELDVRPIHFTAWYVWFICWPGFTVLYVVFTFHCFIWYVMFRHFTVCMCRSYMPLFGLCGSYIS